MHNFQFPMKQLILVAGSWILVSGSNAQTITQKLQKTFSIFEKDSQLKNAISSLYVIDAKTGQVVFDKNSRTGLAPASTQKIITSVTAFELLGKDYRYKTELGYEGNIKKDSLDGFIFFRGTGDPTFGSWRYDSTKPAFIFREFINKIKEVGIKKIGNTLYVDESKFDHNRIPDGWIWQDIGNYYGAGTWGLNWRENQYDLSLSSGNHIGDEVQIDSKNGEQVYYPVFDNYVKSAAKGTGDNSYIYLPISNTSAMVNGTIPVNSKKFIISGATDNAPDYFVDDFRKFLQNEQILKQPDILQYTMVYKMLNPGKVIYTHYSPSLDSIIYWFNKKSINLYGESLLKTFAFEKKGIGSTDSGVVIIQDFWKQKGLDPDEISIVDGSGLSPLNRVTTHAQVEILKYAKTKDWFSYFYNSLPEYNGMVMKSGTIRGVKGYCGYQKSKNGKEYIFSFLVNNYNGLPDALVKKMYKVLDVLK